jgi:hypothetical protein
MPRGVPHTFANLSSEEVRTVGLLNPPGLEDMFRKQAAYLETLHGRADPEFFLELSAQHGVYPADAEPTR